MKKLIIASVAILMALTACVKDGLYPYTTVSAKQRRAMAEAGLDFVYMGVYDMAFNCIRSLLRP